MSIQWLIAYGLSILLVIICLDKPIEAVNMVGEILKILVSGYLGYLVKSLQDKD